MNPFCPAAAQGLFAALGYACGGCGLCGKCTVKAAGRLSKMNAEERSMLGDELVRRVSPCLLLLYKGRLHHYGAR